MKEKDSDSTKSLKLSEYIAFGFGPIGKNLMSNLVNGEYLPNFFRSNLGISNGFIAVMFFIAKIWDGINDLFMGAIIDRTDSRFGKFRPWIFWGAVTNAIVSVLIYATPSLKGIGTYIYIVFFYLMCDLTFTMIDVGYWSMIPAMTLNAKERDNVSILPRITGAVGGLFGAFTLNIVGMLGAGNDRIGYLRFAMIAAIVYVATSSVCVLGTREHVTLPRAAGEKFSLVRAAKILLRNDQALVVVVIMIFFNAASCMTGGTLFYYFTNVLLKPEKWGFYSVALGIVNGIGLFGVPLLSKKLDRNLVYKIAYLFPCAAYILMMIFSKASPENFAVFAVLAALPSISYGAMSMMQSVMLSDSVDYGEWKSGERNEGIIFSMLTFLSKISNGISYLIRYAGFALVGFNESVGVAASEAAVSMIKGLLFVVPPIFLVSAFLLHQFKFKLTPDKMDDIRSELIERRNKIAHDKMSTQL